MTAVEYIFMLALVSMVALGAWSALGDAVERDARCAASAIGGAAVPCAIAAADSSPGSAIEPGATRPGANATTAALTRGGRQPVDDAGRASATVGRGAGALREDRTGSGPSTTAPASTRGSATESGRVTRVITQAFRFVATAVLATAASFAIESDPRAGGRRIEHGTAARRESSRAHPHRHRLTKAQRRFRARTRLAWRVALTAMRFGTPLANYSYHRAVRIVRFVRRALRRGSSPRSVHAVLRGAVARATPWRSARRDRWARQKLSHTDAWHDYRRAWRRSHPSPGAATPRAVLANPRLHFTSLQRADIAAGRIDRRILAILQVLSTKWDISISSLKSDHGRCVNSVDYPGCSVSNHYMGRAMDIGSVNGVPVTSGNGAAYQVYRYLADRIPGPIRPTELISPWADDGHHDDHIHVGFDW